MTVETLRRMNRKNWGLIPKMKLWLYTKVVRSMIAIVAITKDKAIRNDHGAEWHSKTCLLECHRSHRNHANFSF